MKLQMRIRSVALLAALVSAGGAQAQVANGSFENLASENGTVIAGWGTIGNAFTSSTARFSTPTSGTYQATLATTLDGQYGEPAGSGASASSAEAFLGLSGGSLTGVGNGGASLVSAISQTVHMNAGDQFIFSYNFLTNEVVETNDPNSSAFDRRPDASRNDFGFFSFSLGGTSSVTKLIDTFYGYNSTGPGPSDFDTGFTITPNSDPLVSESGYLTFTFTASTAGDYLFGLGVANAERGTPGTSGINSGMLFDNVRYVPFVAPPGGTTPAPAAMMAFGVGMLGRARRRKRA